MRAGRGVPDGWCVKGGPGKLRHGRGVVGHAFGEDLGGDGIGEAAAGGQVDGLQDAVHGPADRGAVSALVPRREFQVAGVFRQSGIGGLAERAGSRRLGPAGL